VGAAAGDDTRLGVVDLCKALLPWYLSGLFRWRGEGVTVELIQQVSLPIATLWSTLKASLLLHGMAVYLAGQLRKEGSTRQLIYVGSWARVLGIILPITMVITLPAWGIQLAGLGGKTHTDTVYRALFGLFTNKNFNALVNPYAPPFLIAWLILGVIFTIQLMIIHPRVRTLATLFSVGSRQISLNVSRRAVLAGQLFLVLCAVFFVLGLAAIGNMFGYLGVVTSVLRLVLTLVYALIFLCCMSILMYRWVMKRIGYDRQTCGQPLAPKGDAKGNE
jgi:hypothetical protein